MCTLTQMEQPTDMGCRTALFEVPWARSWKWLGPDLVPSLTTYQVLWCSGRRRRNTLRWKPNWNHDDGYSIMIMVIIYIYDYSVIIIIILMVVHDHDPWVWWAQSMHSLYSAFFFRDWLSSVVPEVCFLQHVEWHCMGALRSKDLPTWMNHFAVILIGPHQRRKTYWHIVGENDMPSDLARWTKLIPIPHPYYSTPSNHGLIGDSHILIVFFCTVRIYWGIDSNSAWCFPQQLTHVDTIRHPLDRCRRQAGLPDLRMVAMSPLAEFSFDPMSFPEHVRFWLLSPGWRLMICEGIIPNILGVFFSKNGNPYEPSNRMRGILNTAQMYIIIYTFQAPCSIYGQCAVYSLPTYLKLWFSIGSI